MAVQYYCSDTDSAKYIYLKRDNILQPKGEFHDSIEMIFMISGEAEGVLNKKKYRLKAGDIFFVDSYEGHSYKQLSESILAYVLVLSREYVQNFRSFYEGQTLATHMTNKSENEKIFSLIENWYKEINKTHIKNLGYANILFSYFIESYPLIKQKEKNNCDEFIKILLLYLHEHYLEEISLAQVAKMLGYSSDYCSRALKKSVGRDFREYVNMLRIRKVNELLADKSLRLTKLEVLYKCGFQSPATYYRVKKKFDSKNTKKKK